MLVQMHSNHSIINPSPSVFKHQQNHPGPLEAQPHSCSSTKNREWPQSSVVEANGLQSHATCVHTEEVNSQPSITENKNCRFNYEALKYFLLPIDSLEIHSRQRLSEE